MLTKAHSSKRVKVKPGNGEKVAILNPSTTPGQCQGVWQCVSPSNTQWLGCHWLTHTAKSAVLTRCHALLLCVTCNTAKWPMLQ